MITFKKIKFNIDNVILMLLCLVSFLNFFVPRFAEEDTSNYFVRLPIQIVYVLITLITLVTASFYKNAALNRFLKPLFLFILFVLLYLFGAYTFWQVSGGYLTQYFRLLTWVSALVFFVRFIKVSGNRSNFLTQLYILLFMVVAIKKMIEIRMMVDERLGGDTTGLTLVLLIPALLLFFKNNARLILTVAAIILVMISIRRTAIVALILSSPFLYSELKAKVKGVQIFLFLILLSVSVYYAWNFLGILFIIGFKICCWEIVAEERTRLARAEANFI